MTFRNRAIFYHFVPKCPAEHKGGGNMTQRRTNYPNETPNKPMRR